MLVTSTSLRKKSFTLANTLKSLFSVLERKKSMMDDISFLIVFLCFSLVLGDSSENHEMPPSSDRKKINHPSSKKKSFLSNTWNTLKTSFLKCLRVCNFFFPQRCCYHRHLKKDHFLLLCENRLLNFRSQLTRQKTQNVVHSKLVHS